ncbi:MAG TPA: acetylxylan esterase [Candidatus Methylacidiphilales bacterium]
MAFFARPYTLSGTMPLAHAYPFDPAYGMDEAALRAVPAPEGPADFDAFWRATRAEAGAVPLRMERRPSSAFGSHPTHAVEEVYFDSLGGLRIGAWLSVPRGEAVTRAAVVGHGYGGREEPEFLPDAAALAVCVRGFGLSRSEAVPGEALRHVVHGIESRERYVIRGCVADLWAGAAALAELFPGVPLRYEGCSFGGGLGALAVPWELRWERAFLDVPTFGNHPLRVTLRCEGSGAAVRARWRREPEVLDVLAYFDAATAAKRIAVPTLVSPALFDPVVPPPGQFAVANAIPERWKEVYVREAGHFDHPGLVEDEKRLGERLRRWRQNG